MFKRIGQILVELTALTAEHIELALERQRSDPQHRLGEILLQEKAITQDQLLEALAQQFQLPLWNGPLDERVDIQLFREIPTKFIKKHRVLPFSLVDGQLTIGVADPTDLGALDELAVLLAARPMPVLCKDVEILKAINRLQEETVSTPESVIDDLSTEELDRFTLGIDEPENLLDSVDDAPIIKLVNLIFSQAVRDRASDIHIEPYERELKVRYRIDGFLYDRLTPPKSFQSNIISRIKVLSNLDIAEKRLPQDGRIKLRIGEKDIDVRVSIVPTSHGERVAMRLLDRTSIMLGLDEIGLNPGELEFVAKNIRQSHGIILVTGPTGSGKTTSLYAALTEINSVEKNIITVEDPIEYQLRGIGQIQVSPKIGLTFARGLRSILRQDPDVIMVGEIRDLETAEIAIQASLTGHLVLSTLHTNDSASAFTRLIDMGIEPFLVSSSLLSIMAQRLVRVLCSNCKIPVPPQEAFIRNFELSDTLDKKPLNFYQSAACNNCYQTGFIGRTGIYEILAVTNAIQRKIMDRSDASTIKEVARAEGMQTLKMSGARKVLTGATSVEEVLRVVSE
ncbi:type II secretion system ATPase GspE [candidate division CSSED10-310 bacterium]|uniref:protein-secreting ATPase n=1 Tax=candidate division CSSED10-310 bacterium TaxID=2855610 RepID=A0ABV6Z4C2_UNCC1